MLRFEGTQAMQALGALLAFAESTRCRKYAAAYTLADARLRLQNEPVRRASVPLAIGIGFRPLRTGTRLVWSAKQAPTVARTIRRVCLTAILHGVASVELANDNYNDLMLTFEGENLLPLVLTLAAYDITTLADTGDGHLKPIRGPLTDDEEMNDREYPDDAEEATMAAFAARFPEGHPQRITACILD